MQELVWNIYCVFKYGINKKCLNVEPVFNWGFSFVPGLSKLFGAQGSTSSGS